MIGCDGYKISKELDSKQAFRKSDKGKKEYGRLSIELRNSEETSKSFEKYAQTCWLCRPKVARSILNNW